MIRIVRIAKEITLTVMNAMKTTLFELSTTTNFVLKPQNAIQVNFTDKAIAWTAKTTVSNVKKITALDVLKDPILISPLIPANNAQHFFARTARLRMFVLIVCQATIQTIPCVRNAIYHIVINVQV